VSLRRRLLGANLVLAALVAVIFLLLLVAVLSLRQASARSEHSARVIAATEAAEKSVLDLETGARGFALTGRDAFLHPWRQARRALPGELARVRRLVADNPRQAAQARQVSSGVARYERDFSEPFVAEARRSMTAAGRLARAGEGKARVDALRAGFERMLGTERALSATRQSTVDARRTMAIVAVAAGLLICLVFVVLQQAALRRWVLEPLDRLREAAGRLREGDLSTRAGLAGRDEVAEVGAAFDDMAENLEASDADLRRSNAELEQFAYVASHDLAEPLRVMAGYADLLSRKYAGELDERADGYIAGITDGSERMRQLIDDLLAYSRAGRRELDMQPVDMGRLVATVTGDLAVALREADAEVHADGLPTVTADPSQMRIVLQNLMANAVKFHSPDRPPRVDVVADRDGDHWRFEVRDNGIGIEPRHTERIFRMFQRLHTREEYPGTGIGLALCQRVIERHGGEIHAAPRPDGPGAVIAFTLPAG
jgi:signal transduction histidine kinase